MKTIKGEKYIYLASAYALAKSNGGTVQVGHDSGMKGDYLYWRSFTIRDYMGKELLIERKSSQNFADFTRAFEVAHYSDKRPTFRDYVNESGENCATRWVH